jgi:hypothetical protein
MRLTLPGKSEITIIEVHLNILPNTWSSTRKSLTKFLKSTHEASITPLYYSSDIEDFEVRICYVVTDVSQLDEYIVKGIRKIPGVLDTRVRLTLNGKIYPENFKWLFDSSEKEAADRCSCHLFLKISPEHDDSVWKKLTHLPTEKSVCPVWVFRDFYEYDRDLTLRLIGQSPDDIRDYVDRKLCKIKGISHIRSKFMHEFTNIAKKEYLIQLADIYVRDHN